MSFLSTNIHRVSKVAVSSATQLSDDSPDTLIRDIVITAENGETYEITLFSKKDELIPLEIT
jgi:hypothetical protein